jgi:hypothetical protein
VPRAAVSAKSGAALPRGSPGLAPAGPVPANVAFARVGASSTRFVYVADPGTGQFSVVNESNDAAPVVVAIGLPSTAVPNGVAILPVGGVNLAFIGNERR